MTDIKMVIVMRTDLNMRKGKMVAQGAHAASGFLQDIIWNHRSPRNVETAWVHSGQKKICVGVADEEGLLDLYRKAREAGLTAHIITDSGMTEFHGKPTKTCIAIGPDIVEKIDKLTGHLRLL